MSLPSPAVERPGPEIKGRGRRRSMSPNVGQRTENALVASCGLNIEEVPSGHPVGGVEIVLSFGDQGDLVTLARDRHGDWRNPPLPSLAGSRQLLCLSSTGTAVAGLFDAGIKRSRVRVAAFDPDVPAVDLEIPSGVLAGALSPA